MEIILKDGVKFIPQVFTKESEFEGVVLQQVKHIFGGDAILFDKRKITTETGIKTIPDAFVVCPASGKWYVVEIELASHHVYNHIFIQIGKFKTALRNHGTRDSLIRHFDREIGNDLYKHATWATATGDKNNVYKLLSQIIRDEPEIIIIIDAHNPELNEALASIHPPININIFKSYCREGTGTGDFIHQFSTSSVREVQGASNVNQATLIDRVHAPEVKYETQYS